MKAVKLKKRRLAKKPLFFPLHFYGTLVEYVSERTAYYINFPYMRDKCKTWSATKVARMEKEWILIKKQNYLRIM